jgi:hypothetical protein
MTDQPKTISRKYADDLYTTIKDCILGAQDTMPRAERLLMTLDALGRAVMATVVMINDGDVAKSQALVRRLAETIAEKIGEVEG